VPGGRATDNPLLALSLEMGQTRAVERGHGRAEEAGEQMHSELDAIQERLRSLKRRLDARESVVSVEGEIARGDAVEMNPLTASERPPG
jgi:hypothetical protein